MSEFYIDQDGRRQGEHDRYYPNGELWETINYKNNQKHGYQFSFYSDGGLHQVIEWFEGVLHGDYKVWNTQGDLELHEIYIDGISAYTVLDERSESNEKG